MIDSVRKRHC